MDHFSENIRYLLLQKSRKKNPDALAVELRDSWLSMLARSLDSDRAAANELLCDTRNPTSDELERLAAYLREEPEMVRNGRLTPEGSILRENVLFLFGCLGHGEQKEFAQRLEVNSSTIQRWKSGGSSPSKPKQQKLKKVFGLPSTLDLSDHPLFLDLDPISSLQRIEWLCGRVRSMDQDELNSLFPALKKLLEDK